MKTKYKYLFSLLTVTAIITQMLAGYRPSATSYSPTVTPNDTLAPVYESAFPQPHQGVIEAKIHVLARAYGDSIVLRWSGEDYVTQRRLNYCGVNIFRIDKENGHLDTLAMRLRPWTLEQFRAAYTEEDSLAYGAMGLLYPATTLQPDQTHGEPGSFESLLEIYDDQQTRFGFTVLMSEWRLDLADRMAMRFCDHTARHGHAYEYIIQPSERDSVASVQLGAGMIQRIENVPYHRTPFDVEIGDTITGPYSVRLWWAPQPYSTYEIERRKANSVSWQRVNPRPYLMMSMNSSGNDDCFYKDIVEEPGDYEYRIMAHDAFGDLTLPSPIHKVHIPDLSGPHAPILTSIEIERTNPDDLMDGVMATFHIYKDSIEDDFAGFMPLYYHEKWTGKDWRPLSNRYFSATDTVFTIDVTGLSTGMVTIGAYDYAGNASFSMPQLLRLQDVKAPDAPINLKATTDNEAGTVTLTWEGVDDDIEYYEVAFANDTTHQFMLATVGKCEKTAFTDTLDTQVNQRYIYYKVRAVDYSTNEGAYTSILQVQRPSTLIPSVPHIDSTWVNTDGIHMRWGCPDEQQIDSHRLYRRLQSAKGRKGQPVTWDLIGVFSPDSVRAAGNYVNFCDRPPYLRGDRYVYAMESFSCNGLSSGKSISYSEAWEGDAVFEWPIDLLGEYNDKTGETRLGWDCSTTLPYPGEWYFCVWRRGAGEERFTFLLSTAPDDLMFTDSLLSPGESADYYVMIQYADGRESTPSNVVTVTAPKKE